MLLGNKVSFKFLRIGVILIIFYGYNIIKLEIKIN